MLLVGVDDTDSRQGGCTTSLVPLLEAAFPELRPARPPRLVRLNPNVPWKTRGNGAIALAFHESFPLDDGLARVARVVQAAARAEEGTEPGYAVAHVPPDPWLYDAAVTRIVERAEAEQALKAVDARWEGGRGVIGAAAALAWNPFRQREDQAEPQLGAAAALAWPAERATWERIAYRDPARIGTPRQVDPARLRHVEETFPSLFDTYDLVEDDVVCVPSSPCPVLWGLRGTDPDDLARASATLGPERPAYETLFLTNQGTDDHLRAARTEDVRAYASVMVRGRVTARPKEANGSVTVEVEDGTGTLRAMAYPPTRSFRRAILQLDAGDDVTIAGGVHAGPDGRLSVGLEKVCVHETAPRRAGNPICTGCSRAMKSAGRGAGFRCRSCGTRETEARTMDADLPLGWHEVPASARRHLARPLRRGTPGER